MLKRKEGSIVLEASLILPIFLSFIILLISFIKIGLVQIALDNTVAEATKQIATHYYPLDLMYGEFSTSETGSKINNGIEEMEQKREKIIAFEEIFNSYSDQLPQELTTIFYIRKSLEDRGVDAYDATISKGFQPIVDYYAKETILDIANLQVTKVVLPDLRERNQLYFGIEVRYDLPLNIPFFNRTITFKESAYERVWVGDGANNFLTDVIGPVDQENNDNPTDEDSDQESSNSDDHDEENIRLVIESINSPVQRGHNVRIFARGPPNELAYIEIRYQSGFVKSTEIYFDSNGSMKSDIKIGGHANEGMYEVIIKADNQVAKDSFEVLSKDNYKNYKSDREAAVDALFKNN